MEQGDLEDEDEEIREVRATTPDFLQDCKVFIDTLKVVQAEPR